MGFYLIQSDFSHGELDRRLFSRADLQIYNKSAQKLRNVVVIPQGGARRRFGSLFIETITQNTGRYMLTEFQFDAETNYLFLLEPGLLRIFFNDIQVASISIGIPWTSSDLIDQSIRFTQTTNLMVVTGNFAPITILRTSAHSGWQIANIVFRNKPTIPFVDAPYSSITFKLDDVKISKGRTLTATSAIFTSEFVDGLFRAVGPPESFAQIGVARITQFNTSTEVIVEITSTFADALKVSEGGVTGNNVDLEIPVFTTIRGWPKSVTFYEGRLWFGGIKGGTKPNSALLGYLMGSVVNDFFNFDTGTGLDDESIQFPIDSDVLISIEYLVGDRSLQVFTIGGEFAAPQVDETPLTPSNIAIRKQTNNGIQNVRPVVLDNQTFYIARGGKRAISFVYTDTAVSYQSTDISILSPQIVRNPIDSAVIKGSSTDDANYLLYVNGDDGSLAVFQSLLIENVAAWTLSQLEDDPLEAKFQRITQVGDVIYAIIERVDATLSLTTEVLDEPILTESGEEILAEESSVHELIKLSFNAFTDSAIQQTFTTPTTVITGLDHLEDKTVHIRGEVTTDEGFFVFEPQVVLGGQITLGSPVVTVEVGLPFTPEIQPMPVQIPSQQGPTLYIPKRLIRYFIDFFESVGVFLDGSLIPYLAFGDDVLDQPPQITSDLIEFTNLGGWDRRQAPIITQNDPLPMTILGIGYEVEV